MFVYYLLIHMKTIVAVAAVIAILVSIVAVSTLAVTGNIDARTSRSDGGSSAESGFYTAVCGPDPAHACQTSTEQ